MTKPSPPPKRPNRQKGTKKASGKAPQPARAPTSHDARTRRSFDGEGDAPTTRDVRHQAPKAARRDASFGPHPFPGPPERNPRKTKHEHTAGPEKVMNEAQGRARPLPDAAQAPPSGPAFHRSPYGRPSKLTPELTERVCRTIRAGNYVETAAALEGLAKPTLYDWLKRGRRHLAALAQEPGAGEADEADAPYAEFSNAVEQALAASEARDVLLIGKVAEGVLVEKQTQDGPRVYKTPPNWKAAAWRLERKHPDRWGRKDSLEVSGDAPVVVHMWQPGADDKEAANDA